MKTIIAGSRTITSIDTIKKSIKISGFEISEVVCGGANGVDLLGKQWADSMNIPVRLFPADWHSYGKSAGAIRNAQMGEYADALIAVWDGKSRGTKNMIDVANRKGLAVFVYNLRELKQKGF